MSVVMSRLGSLQMAISFNFLGSISLMAALIASAFCRMRGQAVESSTIMAICMLARSCLVPDILVGGDQEVIAFVFCGLE